MKKIPKNGFSLIELLVVMFVIAILGALLLPNLLGARQKAKDAQRISDANAMRDALRLYYNDNQRFPDTTVMWQVLPTYMPGIGNTTGITYTSGTNGDSMTILVQLESTSGDEDTESQRKCGIAEASIQNGVFAVCSY